MEIPELAVERLGVVPYFFFQNALDSSGAHEQTGTSRIGSLLISAKHTHVLASFLPSLVPVAEAIGSRSSKHAHMGYVGVSNYEPCGYPAARRHKNWFIHVYASVLQQSSGHCERSLDIQTVFEGKPKSTHC